VPKKGRIPSDVAFSIFHDSSASKKTGLYGSNVGRTNSVHSPSCSEGSSTFSAPLSQKIFFAPRTAAFIPTPLSSVICITHRPVAHIALITHDLLKRKAACSGNFVDMADGHQYIHADTFKTGIPEVLHSFIQQGQFPAQLLQRVRFFSMSTAMGEQRNLLHGIHIFCKKFQGLLLDVVVQSRHRSKSLCNFHVSYLHVFFCIFSYEPIKSAKRRLLSLLLKSNICDPCIAAISH